jgi:hypothetical protein
MKLSQKQVDDGCKAARARYRAMPVRDAQVQFSSDLQGFVADMVERECWTLPEALIKVTQLVEILAKKNGI